MDGRGRECDGRNEMGVIHFIELDEMVAELSPGQVVRVAVLDVTEAVASHGIRLAGIGVHTRAFNGDHILSCYIPVAGGWNPPEAD